jgi:hypothetical protein
MQDGGDSTLDVLKRMIVGRRGRLRADRLVVTGADGAKREIAIKPQRNPSSYVDLVEACAPTRIEAYAGGELLAVAGDAPPPPPAKKSATAPPAKKSATAPPEEKKKRSPDRWAAMLERVTTHFANLLANAYKANAEKEIAKDAALWGSLQNIAQHHSDRASHAELRHELTAKSVRLANKAINERDALILRLNAKIGELANETNDDKRSTMFMELLGMARGKEAESAAAAGKAAAAAAKTNGATKAKAS